MRQIRFRGLRTDGKGWVYGSYIEFKGESDIMVFFDTTSKRKHEYKHIFLDKHLIAETIMPDEQGWDYGSQIRFHEVTPESVVQYIGLHDKNGVEIYEGDIDINGDVVLWCNNRNGYSMNVFEDATFKTKVFCHCINCQGNFEISDEVLEIIGNIHTNEKGQEG